MKGAKFKLERLASVAALLWVGLCIVGRLVVVVVVVVVVVGSSNNITSVKYGSKKCLLNFCCREFFQKAQWYHNIWLQINL